MLFKYVQLKMYNISRDKSYSNSTKYIRLIMRWG